jgi:hypothetical protein
MCDQWTNTSQNLKETVMSAKVDQFCDKLRDRLNALETHVETLKSNVQKLPKQGEQALQNGLKDVRSKIEAEKKKVEQAQASLKTRVEQKMGQAKEAIKGWKAKNEVSKLNSRADRAEQYAADAVYIAIAAVDEAEEAILDAITARMDAETADAPAAAAR